MADDKWLSEEEVEPGEIEFKGIDISEWLSTGETVTSIKIYVFKCETESLQELDLSEVETLSLSGYDSSHELVQGEDEWTVGGKWTTAKLTLEKYSTNIDVTSDLIRDTGTDDEHYWVESLGNDQYRVGIRCNELLNLISASYQWTISGNEYYLEDSGSGTPAISQPTTVYEDDSAMTNGTLGSLSTGEWAWGDNDSLGFNTIYVRLSDDADPDSKSVNYVECSQPDLPVVKDGDNYHAYFYFECDSGRKEKVHYNIKVRDVLG